MLLDASAEHGHLLISVLILIPLIIQADRIFHHYCLSIS